MIIGKAIKSSFILLLTIMCFGLSAQTTIRGVVTDDNTGEVLIGANVLIAGTAEGTITDFDGTFEINTSQSLPVELEISYTGYTSKTMSATSSNIGNISLMEGLLLTDEIVVSASRRREKIQEAPASISVITARKLEATPNDNPARAIINEPGVYVQQQGAGRVNIQLRGDGGIFGSASFPMLDYRSLSGPGLGTFDNLNSPLNNIDIERIEVVRGPGSALYGPGVTNGVVHFISKSAIDKPGTTFELMGGELSTIGVSVRHATKVSDKFGFKINASYKRGGEFTYDPSNAIDKGILDQLLPPIGGTRGVYSPAIANNVVDFTGTPTLLKTIDDLGTTAANPMQDFFRSTLITGTLEFRPQDDLSVIFSGGTNSGSSAFYNSQGPGLTQATETWVQGRIQKGGLFAQAFWLNNNGGPDSDPTFLYATAFTTAVKRQQLEAQLQYNFDLPNLLNSNWTAGFDYRQSTNDTGNTVYGREEDDDAYNIAGGYLQGKFALGNNLDLVLAGRADKFNFLEDLSFSPRAVLVFKPDPKHTFRAGFNRAVAAPTQLQVNIDFPVSGFNVPGLGTVGYAWLLGNKEAQTFADNPEIVWNSGLQALGLPNLPVGTPGLPNAVTYGAATAGLLPNLIPGLIQSMVAGGIPQANAEMVANNLAGYLANPANFPGGFTGTFEGRNLFNGSPLGLIDAPAASLRTEDTWEFGYKGLIGDKLGISVDVYNRSIDGSTLFTGISPTYRLMGLNIADDLVNSIDQNGILAFLTNELAFIGPAAGPTAQALTAGVMGGYQQAAVGTETALAGPLIGLGDAGVMAWTPTQELPASGVPLYAAGYRTFEEYSYTGADIGLNYFINNDLSLFGNYSWTSDNTFEVPIKGVDGATETTGQSQPNNRYRAGFNYVPEFGWRANASFQHDPSFFARLGSFFTGDTDEKNLLDVGVGYKFDNGLSLSASAQNLFDSKYRAFANFPQIGRRVIGTLQYTFGADGPSDMDGDGVKDSKDMCPNIAGLKAFQGCPDSDADGIKDSDDNCPLAAGDALNGGCPDSDADGVIDNDDKCPNVAGTLMGCPDADGDGVADGDDMCPNAAGTLNGCPDGDGDGVADKDDKCPNAAGNVMGCPDGDGDGVADGDDKCPGTAGDGADGCPSDSDGDGVPNDRDACPDTSGPVNGCPDGDNDGVADKDDKCPRAGGSNVDANGCPKIKAVPAATTAVFSRALRGIQYETGQAVLRSDSYAILDEVVSIMQADPALKVTITGHTDNVGDENRNLDLSINRANAVKKYLEAKGISALRLASSGQGEYRPIADNSTREGRTQNRRVELSGKY